MLLCLRHFLALRRLPGFLSPPLSVWAEPSFFRNLFSTYLALIHASFSCLREQRRVSARGWRGGRVPGRRGGVYRELDGSGFFRPPSWCEHS